jgi:hypothetical protein
MNRRPSRIVVALGRWALMAGLAGIVLAMLALIDRLRAPDNLEARRNLLIIAAVLLSVSFVFAPFARRAFGVMVAVPRERQRRKTLLDEMRERPEDADLEPALPSTPEPRVQASALTRTIVALYVAFGAALVAVVMALR